MLRIDVRAKCAALIDRQCCMGAGVEKREHCNREIRANCGCFHAKHSGLLHIRKSMALLVQREPSPASVGQRKEHAR